MRIKWLNKALLDLDAETSHHAREDAETAVKMYGYIRSRVDMLGQFPESGRPGRVFGTRELVLNRYPYIVPYRVRENVVEILKVFHAGRKNPLKW